MAAIEQWAAKGQGQGQGLCPPDLPGMLGRLVGRFLLSTESANDEINNDSNEGSPTQESHHDHGMDREGVMNHMDDDNDHDDDNEGEEREGEEGGDVGANHRVIVSSHPPLSPLRASDKAQGPGLEPGSNRSVFRPRPCWHAFSSGGLKLYLSTRWDPHLSHP